MFTSPAPATASSLSAGVISLAVGNPASSSAASHPRPHLRSRPEVRTDGPAASASASASSASTTTTTTTATASRTRRGLSYLRNYTQNHLLSRDHSSSSNSANYPTSPVSPVSPTSSSSFFRPAQGLTRSTSDTPSAAGPAAAPAPASYADRSTTNPRRFTLVPTWTHPLNASSSSRQALDDDEEQIQPLTTTRSTPLAANLPPPTPSQPQPPLPGTAITTSDPEEESTGRRSMTRSRSATTGTVMAASSSIAATVGRPTEDGTGLSGILPSIRFSVFVDPRSTRPSLHFSPIARTLPTGQEVIRVGRYSERDSQPPVPTNAPSSAPVGFKSKVVSRRHCEFWYEEGKWYIKDVKSSSGTFLNHIRLSPPGQESKPFPVNDGDVVQLGIDFKGGEEMIFRCVKMRLELNRGWQNKLNKFNMSSHKRLWNMTKSEGSGKDYSQDCSICLNSIAPCQCLFVAPCSHTWHFKCIRALLSGPNYPIFICPNCRAAADLEAEVEDPEDWEELNGELDGKDNASTDESKNKEPRLDPPAQVEAGRSSVDRIRTSLERARASAAERAARTSTERTRPANPPTTPGLDEAPEPSAPNSMDSVAMVDAHASDGGASTPSTTENLHATSHPMPIPTTTPSARRTPSPGSGGLPTANGHEGPITPRNDAGPWVFDGSGARIGLAPPAGARQSLNGVVDGMDIEE